MPLLHTAYQQRLWNQAYDQAKANDSKTVDAYEKFLSARYSEKDDSTNVTTQQNCIERNPDKRREQMQKLLQDGLKRIAEEENMKQGMESGIQAVLAVKEVVDKAVQASSEAALAWVGVCFALEILMNPLTEASSNRQGIAYVVSRMDWYLNLSDLLLNENIEAHSQSLRGKLEKIITQLYAKLLLYQMKGVCYYHRGRFAVLVGDLVKHYNWDGELSDIKTAEAAVQQDLDQYNTQSIRTRLSDIAKTAKSQNAKLDSISSAIHEQTKQQKTMHETSEDHKCLRDLRATHPRDDKKRIEDLKGGLLKDSYRWILGNSDFQKWHDGPQSRLLWVKADPGKAKTMLLCGIIDELEKSNTPGLLAYFFCQATDLRINSATAVLRGLVYLLVEQQPSLISHVREKALQKYKRMGRLVGDLYGHSAGRRAEKHLIIDALDECTTDLPKLLDFIAKNSSVSPRVKWIVSSRNWPDIEEHLRQAGDKVKLSLELNEESISAAVSTFIEDRVSGLARRKDYDERTRDDVLKYLASHASDTFLWVALVCKNLENVPRRNVMKKLNNFPPGLDDLYTQMMRQISNSDDANVCKRILASIAIVYRPITTKEMASLIQQLEDIADDRESIQEIISSCGSFLTLREEIVYFVHQPAKDFLLTKPSKETPKGAFDEVFPSGTSDVHSAFFSASLQTMSRTLRRDMYDLRALGYPAEQVSQPDPDPLAASRYACFYWIDHLHDSHPNPSSERATTLRDGGSVDTFLRQKCLYWLESLSLCKDTSKGGRFYGETGGVGPAKANIHQGSSDAVALSKLVQVARRFIMYHKGAIEHSPLQAYASALLFSPAGSLVRRLFKGEEPKWATIKPGVRDAWSACLQTLEGHSSSVRSVAFSHDSTRLASASWDKTIKVWNASSGACLQTLEGHGRSVWSVAFSHDSTRLASASGDRTIKIWDASSGALPADNPNKANASEHIIRHYWLTTLL
ncbi:hypothetical protein B0J12DRAFT_731324 [Macrophomina phaseolina]|uniref:NACHT domain-containing protein n=1 Tax=Macrophomina phaseolina TaxID=35725 RepID=A0ABQ8G024_9PEZI|nr:hypothetical protein B0J12DRAFT_731324 [Macrophomina phaseolina]